MSLQIGNLIVTANTLEWPKGDTVDRYCLSIQSLTIKETFSTRQGCELISVAPFKRNFDNQVEVSV